MMTNTYTVRKLAVTTTKKSHATIALAWLRTNVSQRCLGSGSRRGPPRFKYFATVRGETRIPSFIFSSLAIRSSPQMGFSTAIFRIRSRRFPGKRGLPVGLDFHRQKSRNPLRCQRSSVSAFTFISASRHGNIRLRVTIIHRVESSARRGLIFRSWNSASCFRRKRFSAARALWEHAARKASWTRSTKTKDNVRKQCATARKTDEPDINAQDRTLQNLYRIESWSGRTFCGPQPDCSSSSCSKSTCYRQTE